MARQVCILKAERPCIFLSWMFLCKGASVLSHLCSGQAPGSDSLWEQHNVVSPQKTKQKNTKCCLRYFTVQSGPPPHNLQLVRFMQVSLSNCNFQQMCHKCTECAMNGLLGCHESLGGCHLFVGQLDDLRLPPLAKCCCLSVKKKDGATRQFYGLVSALWDEKDWQFLLPNFAQSQGSGTYEYLFGSALPFSIKRSSKAAHTQ